MPNGDVNVLSGLVEDFVGLISEAPSGIPMPIAGWQRKRLIRPGGRFVDTVIACKLFYFPPYRIAGIPVTAPSGAVFSSLPPYFTLLP
ncbi:hypothetical protein, partial [Citrobacter rodentium]|uniref:hypothetical protein n=1 Tax=Citrobacter rodentium TaxID=67825 RepID=UPI001C3ECCEE